ncbi:MAG: 2-keto-4-pentenoate hydratase [Allosphingosinicella sp.]|uniref:2-keto-4-pentenoate hydratase n=1 Tax=Allosphingosinicella sp. TaxID=2823234 RepID=UPI00393B5CDE
MTAEDIRAIAERLVAARKSASGLADFPGAIPPDLDTAYAIQDEMIAMWRRPVIGWKIGRVMPPLSERFGTLRLAGPIFAAPDGADPEMAIFADGSAAAETEFLLRIGTSPPEGQASFTLDEAIALIDAVHVGIEIASSPVKGLNALGPTAVTADFGNNNGLVIGPEVVDWRSLSFELWPVVTTIDGAEVGSGASSSLPGGVFEAARFLFELMAGRGIALEPGQWISSGAITGVHPVRPDQRVEAIFRPDVCVSCRISAATCEPADRVQQA